MGLEGGCLLAAWMALRPTQQLLCGGTLLYHLTLNHQKSHQAFKQHFWT